MKYQELKKALGKPYFSNLDILLKKLNVYNYQLSLWRKKGYVSRLKRGIYLFTDEKEKISPEEVSFLIYQPSYLSLEYALSHWGLIPEIVYMQTALTTKTTRKFSNEFGNFSYRHIQPKLFFGYIAMETPEGKYLLAEPEKALLDYFYFNLGKLNNKKDLDELRINTDELCRIISKEKINSYLMEFDIAKLTKLVTMLLEIC